MMMMIMMMMMMMMTLLVEHRCRYDALRCDSGRCVPPQLICDGYIDCGLDDDSDERNCTGKLLHVTCTVGM